MAKKENKNIHEITVKIEGKDWTEANDKVFEKKQKTVKVDGFRKGKVPRTIFEKKVNIIDNSSYDSKRNPQFFQEIFRIERTHNSALRTYGHQG